MTIDQSSLPDRTELPASRTGSAAALSRLMSPDSAFVSGARSGIAARWLEELAALGIAWNVAHTLTPEWAQSVNQYLFRSAP